MKIVPAILAITLFAAGHASAHQDSEPASADSEPQDEPGHDGEREQGDERSRSAAPAQAIGYSGQYLWGEGASLIRAIGRLGEPDPSGRTFHIEPTNPQRDPISIVLLPTATLERMEQAQAERAATNLFEVTGTIHVFDGRPYLLPLAAHGVTLIENAPLPTDGAPQPEVPAETPAAEPPVNAGERSIEEIIAGVERDVPITRSLPADESSPASPQAPGDASPAFDDGEILTARRGIVSRGPSGEWTFSFAADAAGLSDPPMTLLPCELLETIRGRVQTSGGDPFFVVTGRVYRYAGAAFLLPVTARAEDVEKKPNLRGR